MHAFYKGLQSCMTNKQARSKIKRSLIHAFYTLKFNAFFHWSNKKHSKKKQWYIPTLHRVLLCFNLMEGHTYSWMGGGGSVFKIISTDNQSFTVFPRYYIFNVHWLFSMTKCHIFKTAVKTYVLVVRAEYWSHPPRSGNLV